MLGEANLTVCFMSSISYLYIQVTFFKIEREVFHDDITKYCTAFPIAVNFLGKSLSKNNNTSIQVQQTKRGG